MKLKWCSKYFKLERQKFENESTQHKSLWTDYIYVTSEQKNMNK